LLVRGRGISRGIASGVILVSRDAISFLSGVDPETGTIVEKGHPLCGRRITGTILAFPYGKGSTVGSYILYALSRNGNAPAAIINEEAEPIIATGAILGKIPMIDRIGIPVTCLKDGVLATLNGELGTLEYDGELSPC